jgi:tetratricopeptide (TPR) repeat protein
MSEPEKATCPANVLASAAAAVRSDSVRGLAAVDDVLKRYPRDARLHFLRGSVLAGLGRFDEARKAIGKALRIAPGFAIARFQLGFLELTSGAPVAAQATWAPLETLPRDHPLRIFMIGLTHLIRDEFAQAIAQLSRGMELNTDNPALNGDMQLIIDELRAAGLAPQPDEAVSEAHWLLRRYPKSPTRH